MGKSVPVQHPAVVLRSQYRNLRSLVAVLLVALAALTASVVILSIDGDGTSTAPTFVGKAPHGDPFAARTQPTQPQGGVSESSVAAAISQSGSRSYPTLADSFQAQTEQPKPQGGVSESSVASAISQSGSRSYPTLADSFQAQTEQPKPQALGGPDESRIAATLGAQSDTGAQARGQAWQEKLQSMTPQEREQAFGGR